MAIITDGVKTKFTDDTGLPLIGGQVFSYVEGTSTPKDTYQDRAFTIPNTNPIILDDAGSCQMYLKGGYRLRVLTADGVLVEEKDNAFQSDGQVLDVVANTTAIAALQTNVDVLNTRGGLKTDENNHVIGQGKAESATVYDLSLRSDKIRVSAPTDVEFGDLVFNTYDAPTAVNGVTIPKGTWLNPALVVPLLGTAATRLLGTGAEQIPLSKDIPSLLGTAATKNVGKNLDNLPTAYDAPEMAMGGQNKAAHLTGYTDANNLTAGVWLCNPTHVANTAPASFGYHSVYVFRPRNHNTDSTILQLSISTGEPSIYYRAQRRSTGSWDSWGKLYSSMNTTVVNGSLKPSSPVVKIHTDSLELNEDAERMGVILNKRGVGDYLLQNTTGLRNDGGWRIELPQDVNGNPYFAVAYNELENNDIEVKTYKRIFDMNTFMFVPDLENPVDIKEGSSIAIRFNDLPLDDFQMEV